MIVMKFGGTSVADCAAITRTIGIVESKLQQRPIVVVSALSKVTDLLYKISDKARGKDNEGKRSWKSQQILRSDTLHGLLPGREILGR